MAGHSNGIFKEKLSPYLREKHCALSVTPEKNRDALRAIELQYFFDPRENAIKAHERRRHFEADLKAEFERVPLRGVERLYRRTIVIQPTMVCAAHCRWCVRGQYDIHHLADAEIDRIARFCGSARENADLREALITGGDPLMNVPQLRYLMEALERHAPQIEIFRIATRVPLQEPSRISMDLLDLLNRYRDRAEIGLHANHAAELFPEVRAALRTIRGTGVQIYNQTVLLRGLNDNAEALIALANALRSLRIENHYLFHCVPIRGMSHHRTSLGDSMTLVSQLTSSGKFSGRAKPQFTVMTDIGKITPYENTILARNGKMILLQSQYDYEERLGLNPHWKLPASAAVDDNGRLTVWYEDVAADPKLGARKPMMADAS